MKTIPLTAFALVTATSLLLAEPQPVTLLAKDAKLKGMVEYVPKTKNIGHWDDVGASATWTVKGLEPGVYDVTISYALKSEKGGQSFKMSSSTSSAVVSNLEATGGDWYDFKKKKVGTIKFSASQAMFTITATQIPGNESLMNLSEVLLEPSKP